MEKNNIPWEAIAARLKNEADKVQKEQIQQWLDASEEHPVILSGIIDAWSITQSKTAFYTPDLAGNWQKLMERINYQPKQKELPNRYFRWVAAAAILVIGFLLGSVFNEGFLSETKKNITYTSIVAPKGSKTQVVLPDSTRVWLNSGAELQYASNYSAQNREVNIKGEAYFDVVKDPDHPFVVHGPKFQVKVFGTSFNMNEARNSEWADITLVSGSVQVLSLQGKKLCDLKPGEQLLLKENQYQVQKAENLEALDAWRRNMLIFDNQPFDEVIPYLEKWYGVKITLDKAGSSNHRYTFKVKTESLREVLNLISIITPIAYCIEGEQITIKYKRK